MALIKCPECGGQISDKAPACIHCGCPIISEDNNGYKYSCKVDGKVIDLTYLEKSINELSLADKEDLYKQCRWIFEDWIHPGVDKPVFNSNDNIQIALNAGNVTNAVNKFLGWNTQNKKAILAYKLITLCIENKFNGFSFNTDNYITNEPQEVESHQPTKQPTPQQPTANSNVVRCPRCNSTAVTTEERGYDIIWGWIGSSWKKNLCQKCGYTWTPGTK